MFLNRFVREQAKHLLEDSRFHSDFSSLDHLEIQAKELTPQKIRGPLLQTVMFELFTLMILKFYIAKFITNFCLNSCVVTQSCYENTRCVIPQYG